MKKSGQQRRNRRRNYFIKKEFQGKYIFTYFLFMIVGTLFFALLLAMLSVDSMSIAYDEYGLHIDKTPFLLFSKIFGIHWLLMVVASLIVIAASMILTHRVAGPMHRFELSLDKMIGGDFQSSIRLRGKDEGQEIAARLNDLSTMLSGRIGRCRDLADRLDTRLHDLLPERGGAETHSADEAGALAEAARLSGEVREILHQFKLKPDLHPDA